MTNHSNSTLLHLTPGKASGICGVSDYARALKKQGEFVCDQARHSIFHLGTDYRNSTETASSIELNALMKLQEKIADLNQGNKSSLPTTVLLHYSGYGYSKSGAPTWLSPVLNNLKKDGLIQVATFFHELFARGLPWQRCFWQTAIQKRVVTELLDLSDVVITNRHQNRDWLAQCKGYKYQDMYLLPVCSNVGEMAVVGDFPSRTNAALLFGNKSFRNSLLTEKRVEEIRRICRFLGIDRIYDIGSPTDSWKRSSQKCDIEFNSCGYLDATEVSSLLRAGQVAFFDYYPGSLFKSGAFAAFASHGVPVVMSSKIISENDSLLDGTHFFSFQKFREMIAAGADAKSVREMLSASSKALHSWYSDHSLACHYDIIMGALSSVAKNG